MDDGVPRNDVNQSMQPNLIQRARKGSDLIVLIITLVLTGLFLLPVAIENSDILILLVLSLPAALVMVNIFQASLLANNMRVQNGKHAYLLNIANEVTKTLNAPPVDIYITQNPTLNAFAIGYTRPFSIVLNSSVVERLSDQEIKAILLHEVGHIIYHHTIITSYTSPLQRVPVFGGFVVWLFGFWSRRAELTCDRLAVSYMGEAGSMLSALMKIHVGVDIAEYMGEEGVLYQKARGNSLMRQASQSLSSHPFLVTRVTEIIEFSSRNNIPIPNSIIDYLNPSQPSTTKI